MSNGDTTATAAASAQAAQDEANNHDYGTSQADVEAYASAAVGVAAAAVCGAISGGTLAVVCGWLGSTAAGWLAGKIYDWFSGDRMADYQRRQAALAREMSSQALAWNLDAVTGQQLQTAVDDLRAMHDELYPGTTWTDPGHVQADYRPAMLLLIDNGLAAFAMSRPVLDAQGADTGDSSLGCKSLIDYHFELDALGTQVDALDAAVRQRAQDESAAITRAYLNSVLVLGAQHLVGEVQTRITGHATVISMPVRHANVIGFDVHPATTTPAPAVTVRTVSALGTVAASNPPEAKQGWLTASTVMAGSAAVGAAASLLGVLFR